MLEYKGYTGRVDLDNEAEILHGEVCGLRDVITFQGGTAGELKTAFQESIDDYLEFCQELGQEPDRAFSGNLLVRIATNPYSESRSSISLFAQWTRAAVASSPFSWVATCSR